MSPHHLPAELFYRVAKLLPSNEDRARLAQVSRDCRSLMANFPWSRDEYEGCAPHRQITAAESKAMNGDGWLAMNRQRARLAAKKPCDLHQRLAGFFSSRRPDRVLASIARSTPETWRYHGKFRRALKEQGRAGEHHPLDDVIDFRRGVKNAVRLADVDAARHLLTGRLHLDEKLLRTKQSGVDWPQRKIFWTELCAHLAASGRVHDLEHIAIYYSAMEVRLIALSRLSPASDQVLDAFWRSHHTADSMTTLFDHTVDHGLIPQQASALHCVFAYMTEKKGWTMGGRVLRERKLSPEVIVAAEQRGGPYPLHLPASQSVLGADRRGLSSRAAQRLGCAIDFYQRSGLAPFEDDNPQLSFATSIPSCNDGVLRPQPALSSARLTLEDAVLRLPEGPLQRLQRAGLVLSTRQVLAYLCIPRGEGLAVHRERLMLLDAAGVWRHPSPAQLESAFALAMHRRACFLDRSTGQISSMGDLTAHGDSPPCKRLRTSMASQSRQV